MVSATSLDFDHCAPELSHSVLEAININSKIKLFIIT